MRSWVGPGKVILALASFGRGRNQSMKYLANVYTFLSSIFVSLHSLARILVRSCCPAIPSPLKCSCSPGRYSWQNQKKALDGFLGARGSTSDFLFLVLPDSFLALPPAAVLVVFFCLGADVPVVADGLVLGLACDISWGRTVLAMAVC